MNRPVKEKKKTLPEGKMGRTNPKRKAATKKKLQRSEMKWWRRRRRRVSCGKYKKERIGR